MNILSEIIDAHGDARVIAAPAKQPHNVLTSDIMLSVISKFKYDGCSPVSFKIL